MSAKFRMFSNVHKGLRHALYTTAFLAGEMDYTQAAELDKLAEAWGNTYRFLQFHGHHEDTHCNKPLEEKAPGSAQYCMDDHVRIEHNLSKLQTLWEHILNTPDAHTRAEMGYTFYHELNLFVADYIRHMHDEETNLTQRFMTHFTVPEMLQMEGNIVAALSPEEKAIGMRYMLPAMNKTEIAEFLTGVRHNTPAPAFEAMVQAATRALPAEKWQAVETMMQQEAVA